MFKCTILIPVNYNNGLTIEKEKIDTFLRHIFRIAGGYTRHAEAEGHWYRSDDGKNCVDRIIPIVVCVPEGEGKLNALKNLVSEYALHFQQDCIYFEVCNVYFDCVGSGGRTPAESLLKPLYSDTRRTEVARLITVSRDVLDKEGYTSVITYNNEGEVILLNNENGIELFSVRDSHSGWCIPTEQGKVLEFCRTIF